MIDNQNLDRGLLRFQLQTELFLNRCEEADAVGIGCGRAAVVGGPTQREIVGILEVRFCRARGAPRYTNPSLRVCTRRELCLFGGLLLELHRLGETGSRAQYVLYNILSL